MHNGGPNDMASTNETKWTPGPWTVAPFTSNPQHSSVAARDDVTVAEVFDRPADARLIAAAPDLYAALEAFMRLGTMDDQAAIDAARAALAKARGEVRS
jgi:hypothetical protein